MSKQPVIEARGLMKRYGTVVAMNGADFDLYPGEICAVIGDNGAGKSTLIKALSGAVVPDHGEATVFGHLRRALEFNLERTGRNGLPHPDGRPSHAELKRLYVAKSAQGLGLGTKLLAEALGGPAVRLAIFWSVTHVRGQREA